MLPRILLSDFIVLTEPVASTERSSVGQASVGALAYFAFFDLRISAT
jgi:hypothetical protein